MMLCNAATEADPALSFLRFLRFFVAIIQRIPYRIFKSMWFLSRVLPSS